MCDGQNVRVECGAKHLNVRAMLETDARGYQFGESTTPCM
jgi:hypothetical protein